MNSHYVTIIGYLIVLAAGVALQVLATAMPPRLATLGEVFTHVTRTRTGRVGIFVAGAWAGLRLFARYAPPTAAPL
jgi:Family of unknown function (DUF6186)